MTSAIVTPIDIEQRLVALDPTQSFCVTAPAGSGKTELLSQRVLALLARAEPSQAVARDYVIERVTKRRGDEPGRLRQKRPCPAQAVQNSDRGFRTQVRFTVLQ